MIFDLFYNILIWRAFINDHVGDVNRLKVEVEEVFFVLAGKSYQSVFSEGFYLFYLHSLGNRIFLYLSVYSIV